MPDTHVYLAHDLSRSLPGLIAAAGCTQAEIALRLRIDPAVVSLWCRGRRPVPGARLAPLAEALGITLDELLDGQPAASPDVLVVAETVEHFWPDPAGEPYPVDGYGVVPEWHDAATRYTAWARREAELEAEREQRARAFRATLGQVHYAPAVEPLTSGPALRCRLGHWGCGRQHPARPHACRAKAAA